MNSNSWNEFLLPYEQMVDELCVKFLNLKKEFLPSGHSPIENVVGRVKKVSSILDKATRKGIPLERIPELIEDIGGIRIICRFVADIDRVIGLIKERDGCDMTIVKEHDYITNTKPSGYRSYHIIIKYPLFTAEGKKELFCEIQIRTLAMNFWATIEHSLRYKYNGQIPDDLQIRLIVTAEAAFRLDKEMGTIRDEIIEVQKTKQVKNELVDQTLMKLQQLYFVAKLENVNELYKKFYELYAEGDLAKLKDFYAQLKIMSKIYKI